MTNPMGPLPGFGDRPRDRKTGFRVHGLGFELLGELVPLATTLVESVIYTYAAQHAEVRVVKVDQWKKDLP